MNQKYLYFSTGAGINSIGEAVMYPVDNFRGMRPNSATTLDLFFDPVAVTGNNNYDCVRLTVKTGTHQLVIRSIQDSLKNYSNDVARIADMDGMSRVNTNITGVTIYQGKSDTTFGTQNITGTNKTLITTNGGGIDSLSLANATSDTEATVNLYYASQVGTNITDTDTDSNEADNAITASSVILTVSGTAATSDVFENEKVWKSDGTLYGTCTARNSDTEIVFGGGIEQILVNTASLYTGTRYYVLNEYLIESGTTLILDSNDISFNDVDYNLYIKLGDGSVDLIVRQ